VKIIRVPWIQCRADEVDAERYEFAWRSRDFEIMAYSENEARKWWADLSDAERSAQLGLGAPSSSDEELSLF
jgi:hypothetical protein